MADHVVVGRGGAGTKIINRNYPVVEGTTLGTTKIQGRKPDLTPEQSIANKDDFIGVANG